MKTSTISTSSTNNTSVTVLTVKVIVIATIALLLGVLKASAGDSTFQSTSKNIIYLQFSGKSDRVSINYERVFHQGRFVSVSYSAGVATGKHSFSVPLAIHAVTNGKAHHLELALAVVPFVEKHEYIKKADDLDKQVFVKPTIGYRFQQAHSGMFVKVGAGPQVFMDPPSNNLWNFTPKMIQAAAYLGIGFSF